MRWEYDAFVMEITGPHTYSSLGEKLNANINDVWGRVMADKGTTYWDHLQQLGIEGWELVSCFPVTAGEGWTREVVWVFKRPRP